MHAGWVPPSLDLKAAQPASEEAPSQAGEAAEELTAAESPAEEEAHAEAESEQLEAPEPADAGAGLGLVDYGDDSDSEESDSGDSSGEPPPRKFDSFF